MSENSAEISYDQYLDAKGLNCPLPVLKAKLALTRMSPDEILYVEATDPHATIDFHAYCARSGHEIIETRNNDNVIGFYIKRSETIANS
ncbi:MAG: sulfurtransferase TusA family protein [Gammaproteobacteria bacterium]